MPEDIEADIQKMNVGGLYANQESDPLLLQELVEFFNDNYTEHKAIKQVVDVASSRPGFDSLVSRLAHKPKVTSSELATVFADSLHRKLDYPVRDKKFSEGLNRILQVASTVVATFLGQGHVFTRKAFLREMGHPQLAEAVG